MEVVSGMDNTVAVFLMLSSFIVTAILFTIIKQTCAQFRSVQHVHESYREVVNALRERIRGTQSSGQHLPDEAPNQRDNFDNCPICLESVSLALETNCGHVFCGRCIIAYLDASPRTSAVHCPICRRQVTLLMTQFTAHERQDNSTDKRQLMQKIHVYNNRFSGRPVPWGAWLADLPTLLHHLIVDMFTLGGIQMIYRLRLFVCFILAFIYVLSPFDLVPESAFGILGILDDVMVILILLMYCTAIYRIAVRNRQ